MRLTGGWRLAGRLALAMGHAVGWGPALAAAVLAVVVQAPVLLFGEDGGPRALRLAAAFLAVGAGCALPDSMAPLVVTSPVARWVRQWLRVAWAGLPAAACWAALYALVSVRGGVATAGPPRAMAVEAVALLGVGLAGAAGTARRWHGPSGALGGPIALFGLVVATQFLDTEYTPWTGPDNPHWRTIHLVWFGVAVTAGMGLVLANREADP